MACAARSFLPPSAAQASVRGVCSRVHVHYEPYPSPQDGHPQSLGRPSLVSTCVCVCAFPSLLSTGVCVCACKHGSHGNIMGTWLTAPVPAQGRTGGSAGAPRGRSGAGARRRRGRRGAVEKGGRSAVGTARHRCGGEAGPACPLAAATVREADPAGAPGSGARGGGRGGALTSPPLPRGLREGEREGGAPREAAIRRSCRPQLPNSAAWLPGQVPTNLVSPRPSRTRLLFRCSSFFPQDGKPPEMRPPGRRGRIAPSLGTW